MDDDRPPTYNVYSIIEGIVDAEFSSDDYTEARDVFDALVAAYDAPEAEVEATVHLYDTFEDRLLTETTISREG